MQGGEPGVVAVLRGGWSKEVGQDLNGGVGNNDWWDGVKNNVPRSLAARYDDWELALTPTLAVAASIPLIAIGHLVGQLTDLDVLEVDFIAVVLQEDVAFGSVAEIGPVFVLAVGHEGVPLLVVGVP